MGYVADTRPRQAPNEVDGLVKRVLRLSPAQLWRFFDMLVGRPEVTAAGFRISERRLSPRPNAARDAGWTRLHDDGLSYAEIARVYHASRNTVAKAVQRFRQSVDSESLSTPEGGYYADGGQEDD